MNKKPLQLASHKPSIATISLLALSMALSACNSQSTGTDTGDDEEIDDDSEEVETYYFYNEDTSGGIEISSGEFALLTLESANTREADESGSVRQLQLTWEAADETSSLISYTVCERDESFADDCNVLGVVTDSLFYTHELTSLLDATYQSYFVIAETDSTTLTSSEKQIQPGELGRLAGYFKASNPGTSDDFGYNVAISDDGMTIVTATPWEDGASSGINADQEEDYDGVASGAIYVFRYDDSSATWSQTDYLKTSNPERGDYMGFSLALSDDGDTIAVGAYGEDSGSLTDQSDNSASYAGAVFIFDYNGSYWSQTAYLKESNPEEDDRFGYSVALNSDGDRLAVGAAYEDSDSEVENTGAVYIFEKDGSGDWNQTAELTASNADEDDRFGREIAFSGDGETLAVSTPLEASSETGTSGTGSDNSAENAGAVYIFSYDDGLASWSQTAYLKASNASEGDYFGASISLNDEGTLLAVGATYEDSNATGIDGDQTNNEAQGAGAVYLFSYADNSWSQTAYIKGSNTEGAIGSYTSDSVWVPTDEAWGDHFGKNVLLNDEGTVLLVNAADEDSAATGINSDENDDSAGGFDSGAVYRFEFDSETESWQQTHYIKSPNTQEDDSFGNSIDLSADGNALVIGAYVENSNTSGINSVDTGFDDDDENDLTSAGALYLY